MVLAYNTVFSPKPALVTLSVRLLPWQPPLYRWRWRDREHSGYASLTGSLVLLRTVNKTPVTRGQWLQPD